MEGVLEGIRDMILAVLEMNPELDQAGVLKEFYRLNPDWQTDKLFHTAFPVLCKSCIEDMRARLKD